jgi:ribosomal-protein-alanine N-acetyltransferase
LSNDAILFDPSTLPVLITERLTLREPLLSDAPDLFIVGRDYEVQKYNAPVMKTVAASEALIEEVRSEYAKRDGISWVVALTNSPRALGIFGFYHWSHHHRRAEVGYALARDHWGQGIGSEAVRAMLSFGFEQMNLHRIYASTIADNHESVHMLEKIGFVREGTKRESSWEDDGTFHDSAMYGILKSEFRD